MSGLTHWWLGVWLGLIGGLAFAQSNGDRETEPFVGVIVPVRQVDLSSTVEGRLTSLTVNLGDRVKTGQVLAIVDPRAYEKELDARQAAVRVAEAELERASARLRQTGERLDRLKRAGQFVSQEQIRTATEDHEITRTEAQIAQATLAQSQARVSAAAGSVEDTTIRAPFDGAVANVYVSSGVAVRLGAQLLRLVGEELRLRFAVPVEAMTAVQLGTSVVVTPDQSRTPYLAVVDGISPEIDLASRHVFVEARLQLPSEVATSVRAGQTVEVSIRRGS